jgi:hypothetical protein
VAVAVEDGAVEELVVLAVEEVVLLILILEHI